MQTQLFSDLINFFKQTEKLKTIYRHSYTSDPKHQESVAEHSWHICILALSFFPQLSIKIDQLKTLKMLIIHDLAETITGDIPVFTKQKMSARKVYQDEQQAIEDIFKYLSPGQQKEYLHLWQEFELNQSPEANVANAIDKIEAVIQHNISDIHTWDKGDFEYHPYCRNEYFDFDPFMRQFKDFVDEWSMQKIEAANMLDKINPTHVKKHQSKKTKK